MAIVHSEDELEKYVAQFPECFDGGPLLLDSFLRNAIEIDVDAICDGKNVFVAGIMQHIEQAGIHSGDSACSIPPYSLSAEIMEEIKRQTRSIALGLKVKGLINIQFAVANNEIYILEVNPRASRTVPFVAKATGVPVAKIASLVMAGEKLKKLINIEKAEEKFDNLDYFAVKEVVFPFNKFAVSDVILGPEMKSTGEAMGIDKTFPLAFGKAQMGCNNNLPRTGNVFISVRDEDKQAMISISATLEELGYKIYATSGTAKYLSKNGINVNKVNKVADGSPHIVDLMSEGEIQLVINTTAGEKSIKDSYSIRRSAIIMKIPYTTTASGAKEVVRALKEINAKEHLDVTPIQSYI